MFACLRFVAVKIASSKMHSSSSISSRLAIAKRDPEKSHRSKRAARRLATDAPRRFVSTTTSRPAPFLPPLSQSQCVFAAVQRIPSHELVHCLGRVIVDVLYVAPYHRDHWRERGRGNAPPL